ncbi:RraA family protein [Xylophilus rhododendri]|uniref:Putative 4-hydroxy-4-methyl-2-oxoglutarate aldolase n=1 Tax=Xylophilus rhododendri TaxID=2697032 RepID=A0A857J6C3_9BURK|nr:RraA family protein [Xylophilus rhododendri]QHI98348.1 RraA family protein [Xylophilus rhododendri]
MNRPLTGRVPAEAIRRTTLPRLDPRKLARFAALEDLTGTVSDAMDLLGLQGALPASLLAPSLPGQRLVGQAVTVRNVERAESPDAAARSGIGRMGEHEAYNQADPGDVVVIEGLTGVSNMGGQSATVAHRAGCAGAVIDGGFRDPGASRGLGFPIWSRGVTPVTGKWRLETVEINGRVRIAGVAVDAGDLVLADEAGVVFVPFAQVDAVLAGAEHIDAGDHRQKADIAAGITLAALAATKYK